MKTILGIDPGYDRLGICILEIDDQRNLKIAYATCLESNRQQEINKRIFTFGKELEKIILKYAPTELAIEKLFFTTNQKTVMGVSESRGAIIYLAQKLGLKVYDYTPLQIKVALTGYGKATKEQIYFMLQQIFKSLSLQAKKLDDEYDAIAVAYTHFVSA